MKVFVKFALAHPCFPFHSFQYSLSIVFEIEQLGKPDHPLSQNIVANY